ARADGEASARDAVLDPVGPLYRRLGGGRPRWEWRDPGPRSPDQLHSLRGGVAGAPLLVPRIGRGAGWNRDHELPVGLPALAADLGGIQDRGCERRGDSRARTLKLQVSGVGFQVPGSVVKNLLTPGT